MVKIKVSYEYDYELHAIEKKLTPYIDKVKIPKIQNGKFKKAYLDMKDVYKV